MTIVFLLSGWSGSGKDAAANLMCEEMGYRRLAFADEAKKEVSQAYQIPLDYFQFPTKDHPISRYFPNMKFKELDATPTSTFRDLVIAWTKGRRAIHDAVYGELVAKLIQESPGKYVISDWRFTIEERTLRALLPNANIVRARITRTGIYPSDSPSEHELDEEPMDVILRNNGSITDLRYLLRSTTYRISSSLPPEDARESHPPEYPSCDI